MRRRVVITGAGSISPLGVEVDEVWNRAAGGKSGVGPITIFDATKFPVRIAAEVRNWNPAEMGEGWQRWKDHPRQTQFAIAAALKAFRSAGLSDTAIDPLRMGVYLGCGEIFPDFQTTCRRTAEATDIAGFQLDAFLAIAAEASGHDSDSLLEPASAVSSIASILNAQGPNSNFTTACVSSNIALGEAAEVIRRGEADVMFTGGAHSMIHPYGIAGFHRLSTLSTNNADPKGASRPFDLDRDGFVVGEGGILLVLEEFEHARRRGADIWAEVTGWGSSHDAYRITDLEPRARSAVRCIKLAFDDAGLNTDEIDYINAHGSGTVLNDRVETVSLKQAFGERAYRIPISSTKSMTGHLTTACAAMETLLSLMALRRGVVPPTINYETPDPDCDLDYVPNAARDVRCRHVLKNSVGFGGHNVAVVLSRV